MKVLMLGWEFPPFSSGGLGTACYGLTKSLSQNNVEVIFVVPNAPNDIHVNYMRTIIAQRYPGIGKVRVKKISSLLAPYLTSGEYDEKLLKQRKQANYGRSIYEEVERYAEHAKAIAENEEFDVIHAHDWMAYRAGIAAKKASKKPLVVHVHATEFDRTGGHCNQYVYDIEREGMHAADSVIAVSNFTKEKVIAHYGVNPDKVNVVHNGVELTTKEFYNKISALKDYYKIVLFLGRVTIQKGPDWFLYAAKRVLDERNDIKFVFAGSGDMEPHIIEKAAELNIADSIIFAGFIPDKDIDRVYQLADLYVMPSISEPFGITPLEALRNRTPVIISKQSGVSEVINNCIKVDFWDVELMAKNILEILSNEKLYTELRERGHEEVQNLSWDRPAKQCIEIYRNILGAANG